MTPTAGQEHVTLEKFLVYYRMAYDYKALNRNQYALSAWLGHEVDNAITQINRYVWSEHLESPIVIVKHPATWWQHFKQDKFPAWLLKRFPVVYTRERIEFERRVIYPRLPVETDKRFKDWKVVENIYREIQQEEAP